MELLATDATLIPLILKVHGVASHPEDDLVLATAVNADAEISVTGDKELLAIGKYQNVTIVSARDFLKILARNSSDR